MTAAPGTSLYDRLADQTASLVIRRYSTSFGMASRLLGAGIRQSVANIYALVRVADEKTLLIPDRRGNNRIDTLRNIIHDPRVALLFLIPGCGETIRVNGRATISTDPALTQSFVIDGKAPRTVIVVTVERIYYQCAKAIVRSKLWDASRHVERKSLPSAGTILADLTQGKMGGPEHDRTAPERLKATLY